jgi:hypothetical protein
LVSPSASNGAHLLINRKSRLFKVSVSSGHFDWFGLESETAASPRYHDKRGDVIYLKCQAYGPHHKEQKIILVNREGVDRQIDTSKTDRKVGACVQSVIS